MNKVILQGNVTKDIELATTSAGKSIANFSIAVRRKYSDKDGNEVTDFHNCVAFNKTAEILNKYVKKGHKLLVSGELVYDTYEDKTGAKKTIAKIMVDEVDLINPKPSAEQTRVDTRDQDLTPIDDDSLPF